MMLLKNITINANINGIGKAGSSFSTLGLDIRIQIVNMTPNISAKATSKKTNALKYANE